MRGLLYIQTDDLCDPCIRLDFTCDSLCIPVGLINY
jgi:hypothetical protein